MGSIYSVEPHPDIATSQFQSSPIDWAQSLSKVATSKGAVKGCDVAGINSDEVSTVGGSALASPYSERSFNSSRLQNCEEEWLGRADRLLAFREHLTGFYEYDFVVTIKPEPAKDTSAGKWLQCLSKAGHQIGEFSVPRVVSQGAWLRDALCGDRALKSRLRFVDTRGLLLWHVGGDMDRSDIHLLACFLELCQVPEIDEVTARALFKALRLLRDCRFCSQDICAALAHASSYFLMHRNHLGAEAMGIGEPGYMMALFIFVAHTYVVDETCPTRFWFKRIFRRYCTMTTFNEAVMCVLQRRGFVLRIADDDLSSRFSTLTRALWAP